MSPADDEPSLASRAYGYVFFLVLSAAILFAGLRIDRADLSVPFEYDDDTLLVLPMVKAAVETGTHWHNDRLGAPGVQELYDFPVIDHLHFAALWLIGRATPDAVVAFNLYYLMTYPLTALIAMLVLRHFGLSVPAAGCGGLLFAFLPYHALRAEHHYFLSAYYVVPLSLLVALWICRGRLPFFRAEDDGRYRFAPFTRDVFVAILIAAATATAGAYYAFFACALYPVAGLYGWVLLRTWRAAAAAGLVTALVAAGGLVGHAPAAAYQLRSGRNSLPTTRMPMEAEYHGMKLAHLVLPVPGHQSDVMASIRAAYDTDDRYLEGENRWGSLGLVGTAGLIGLLAFAILPVRRGWPVSPLAALVLAAVLLGTLGGGGALFAQYVSPQVRAYNRVSVFIAFLAIIAAVWALDRATAGRRPWVRWVCFLAVVALGVWDQCPKPWFRDGVAEARDRVAAGYRDDAAFYARVERAFPGGTIFTLPFVEYPENAVRTGFKTAYEPGRGYLHTGTVRWSFGAMKGREADQWQREVAGLPVREMMLRLTLRGFDGILVDRRGFAKPADADKMLAELEAELFGAFIVHPDGKQFVFDLGPYRMRQRALLGAEFDALARRDAETVRVLWLDGFISFEKPGEEWKQRWCRSSGEAVFVNPTDRPRTFHLETVIRTKWEELADLKITGDVWDARFPVNRESPLLTFTVTVPPGRHTVRFRCRPPPGKEPPPPRRLTFFVALFKATELP